MFVPTYEYECPKCPRVFEVRQRITEPALTTCDRCGGPIHRLLSPTPFILKGGGWYVTDYPSEARKQATKSESSSSESSSTSGTTPAAEQSSTSTSAAPEKAAPSKAEKSPSKTEKPPAKSKDA
jgi:putative FmdB family regulatory protein